MRRGLTLLLLALLSGCASVPPVRPSSGPEADPWEAWNRKVYSFNDALDTNVLKPATEVYHAVVPPLARTGVSNFIDNFGDIWSTANHFLQLKPQSGLEMGMRVLVNTFFGLGGVLDPASEMKLTRRPEDFGQTLGRWGVAAGPYVMLPLFGPATVRDTAGLLVDRQAALDQWPSDSTGRLVTAGIEIVNARSNLFATTALLDQIALDRYAFVRDAYLARRQDQVYDGAPPLEDMDTEPDEPAKPADPPPQK